MTPLAGQVADIATLPEKLWDPAIVTLDSSDPPVGILNDEGSTETAKSMTFAVTVVVCVMDC